MSKQRLEITVPFDMPEREAADQVADVLVKIAASIRKTKRISGQLGSHVVGITTPSGVKVTLKQMREEVTADV